MKKSYSIFLVLSFIIALSACNKDNNDISNEDRNFDASLPSGQMLFSQFPVDTSVIGYIIPLGHLAPPGHTRPSDHMYFLDIPAGTILYAPASGKVLETYTFDEGNGQHDNRITIGVTNTASYYFMHLLLDDGIKRGDNIEVGQRLGILGAANMIAFDMGVMVKTINVPFIDPKLYGLGSLHCDSPIKHFPKDMQDVLYAKVRRLGQDRDGEICYDVDGTLSGNWIAQDAKSYDPLKKENYDSYFVSFVYGNYDPSKMTISIGNDSFFTSVTGNTTFQGDHVFYVQDDAVKFEDVTPSSGKQVYKLYGMGEFGPNLNQREGLLIVQMMANQKIKIEFFDDTTANDHDFTNNAKIYVR